MTLYWVFHQDRLLRTFDRGFSAGEVPSDSYVYYHKGGWRHAVDEAIERIDTDKVPLTTRCLMLLLMGDSKP